MCEVQWGCVRGVGCQLSWLIPAFVLLPKRGPAAVSPAPLSGTPSQEKVSLKRRKWKKGSWEKLSVSKWKHQAEGSEASGGFESPSRTRPPWSFSKLQDTERQGSWGAKADWNYSNKCKRKTHLYKANHHRYSWELLSQYRSCDFLQVRKQVSQRGESLKVSKDFKSASGKVCLLCKGWLAG